MTREEYVARLRELREEYKRNVILLQKEYAISNNPIKVGDIITDHYHTIKVEGWKLWTGWTDSIPSLTYYGEQYTKQGIPSKRQTDTEMYKENIQYINGVEYKR